MQIFASDPTLIQANSISHLDYQDLVRLDDVFAGVTLNRIELVAHTTEDGSLMLMGESVTGNFFEVMGVGALIGRTLAPSDDVTPGGHSVVVLSERVWRARFAADPEIVGRQMSLNGRPYSVVGVIPASFTGTRAGFAMQLWLPTSMADVVRAGTGNQPVLERREARAFDSIARLRPGVGLEGAATRVAALSQALETEYPDSNDEIAFRVLPAESIRIDPDLDGPMTGVGMVLMAMVGLVLLVACANVANMLLARAASRQREIAVRLALGASRGRLVRQLLAESVMLATVAGVAGVLIAQWMVRLLVSFQPPLPIPLSLDFAVDRRVLLFAFGLSWLTGLLFGLVPALKATRPDLVPSLKSEEASVGVAGRALSARNVLVVGQVTVSLVLLVCASLLSRSMLNARRIDPGFAIDGRVVLGTGLGFAGYEVDDARRFHELAVERIRALPQVRAATLAEYVPLGGAETQVRALTEEQRDDPDALRPQVNLTQVGADYFEVMNIPIVQGRAFGSSDDEAGAFVAVISEAAAAELWEGESPLGRRLSMTGASGSWVEVVGVHRDHKVSTLGEAPRANVYVPYGQSGAQPLSSIVAVVNGDTARALAAMRSEIHTIDPDAPVLAALTMRQSTELSTFPVRMGALLIGVLGAVAGLLAAIGLYGVVAYQVSQRSREIGVRMALGARAGSVVRLVLGQGMRLVGVGLVLGVLGALAASRVLAALLYGISPTDLVAFVGAAALLAGVAVLANALPARRAARIDPIAALRSE